MPALAASPERAVTVVRPDVRSGRLVRTTVPALSVAIRPVRASTPALIPVAAVPESPADPVDLVSLVDRIAAENGVEESLVHSVIRVESNYNARAISPKGAMGMMQLIPSTARRFGVTNAFDPEDNIQGGVRYLKFLLDYYGNDYVRAIAAYNAGEGAVDKYRGVPPFVETQNYVYRVGLNLKTARLARSREPAPTVKEPAASVVVAETYKPIQTSVGADGKIYYRTP